MKLGLLLALLPSLAFGQTKTADSFRMDRLEILVNSLISGKPTTTSYTNMVGSITFLTPGAGILWADQTVSTSAFGSTGSGITQLTGDVTAGPGSGSKPATIANNAVTGAKMANATITDTQVSAISESKITNLTTDLAAVGVSTTNIAAATTTINSSMVTQFQAVGVSTTNIASSTTSLNNLVVHLAGPETITGGKDLRTITSTLTVQGNAFSVGLASFTVVGGTATVAYQMAAGSVKLGNVASGTQCLHADGSGNITGTGADCGSGGGGGGGSTTITWQVDNFLSQVTGSKKAFTLSNVAASTGSLIVVLDGLLQSSASDYTYDGVNTVTMTTAPASNSSSFLIQYTINTSTLAAAMLVNSTDTVTAAKTFLSTVTALGPSNFEVMVASQDVFGVSIATFDANWAVFIASTQYRLEINITNRSATSSGYFLNFSTDTAGRGCDYTSSPGYGVTSYFWNTGAGGSGNTATNYNAIPLYGDGSESVQLLTGQNTSSRHIEFETVEGSSVTWKVQATGTSDYTSANTVTWDIRGRYPPQGVGAPKPVTGICITSSTGYFNAAITKSTLFDAHLEIWRGPTHK